MAVQGPFIKECGFGSLQHLTFSPERTVILGTDRSYEKISFGNCW